MKADAVFEGGGVKVLSLLGAAHCLVQHGYRFEQIAGVSAGAILGAMLAAGYSTKELISIAMDMPFGQLMPKKRLIYRLPYLGKGWLLWRKKGFYASQGIESWVEQLLQQKQVYSFADLRNMKVIISDVTNHRLVVFPDDLSLYGYDEQYPVASAIRMSCSIPIVFQPVPFFDRVNNKVCLMVDGGLLSNFPVWLFDKKAGMPKHPTFGFRTTPLCRENDSPFFTLSRYLSDLHMTIIEGRDERWMREEDYLRTISVESDFPPTMLNIDIQTKKSLIDQGFQAAENFIRDWNFPRYVKKKYLDGDKADTSRNNTTGPSSSKGD